MAVEAKNVSIPKPDMDDGAVKYVDAGTGTLPEDAATGLAEGFRLPGYISNEGITFEIDEEAGDSIQAYGGDAVVSGTSTSAPKVKFEVMELLNPDAIELFTHPDDVTLNLEGKLQELGESSKTPRTKDLVIDQVLKNDVLRRTVIKDAEFSTRGDIENNNDDAEVVEVTYTYSKQNLKRYYAYPADE